MQRHRLAQRSVATLLALVLLAWACPPLVRCMVVVYSIASLRPSLPIRLYRGLFRYKSAISLFDIPGQNAPIHTRMYEPVGRPDAPTIVFVHGLAPLGLNEAGINFTAQRLADGGFRVIIPEIVSEKLARMQPAGVQDIGDTAHWVFQRYGQKPTVVGVSFGGGLVLAAAADTRYARDIKLVVDVSGYNSLNRMGHYYIGDVVRGPNGVPYGGPPPPMGPMLMAFQYMETLVPPGDVLPLRRAIYYDVNDVGGSPEAQQAVRALNPAQRSEYQAFHEGTSDRVRETERQMMRNQRESMASISPEGHLEDVLCPVYLLHGQNDVVIPSGEAEWNATELSRHGEVHLLISAGMKHASLDRDSRRLERTKVGWFLLRILLAADAAHGPVAFFNQ